MYNHDFVNQIHQTYVSSKIDDKISPTETMRDEWYFPVGVSAFEVIKSAISASALTQVDNILDMPCGHGRVLRHLRNMFPDAVIDACDLDKDGVAFCESQFGANPIYSVEDLTSVDFPRYYDIVWVGSLFSHTSDEITALWMNHLAKFLSPTGIIVATFIGRRATEINKFAPFIDQVKWDKIVKEFEATGFGYADYSDDQNHDYIAGSYGVSLVNASRIISIVEAISGVRLFSYMEGGWANNQDVVVFGKPDVYDILPY